MPVSATNSQTVYDALKACGIRLLSVLPETWLVHLVTLAEEDPEMVLVRLAKEEEGVGVSAGSHLAGVKSAMLMQNHGLLASINGIVSLAQLYRIPLVMVVSHRGGFGEEHPWQTEGGGVTEHVLDGRSAHPLPDPGRSGARGHARPPGRRARRGQPAAGCRAAGPRPHVGRLRDD